MNPHVELLPATHYHGPVTPQPTLTGQIGLTHLAVVNIGGRPRHCYVKTYLDDRLRLAHEIAGFCIARCTKIRTPRHGGVLALPTDIINQLHGMSLPAGRYLLAWVTTDAAEGPPPRGQIAKLYLNSHAQINDLLNDLTKWPDLATLVAVDEWTANVDRNMGNLFRHGPGDYSVFDHGELLGGLWCPPRFPQPCALEWNATYRNKMLDALRQYRQLTLPIRSAMLYKSRVLPKIYADAYQHFMYFWTQLFTSSQFAAATTFLEVRAVQADKTLPHRLDMIV